MNTRTIRRVLAGVVGLAIVVGWYFALWSPTHNRVIQLTSNLASANASVAQATTQLATLEHEKLGIKGVQSEVAKLRVALPSSPDLVGFLQALDVAASRVGLSLINITPTQPATVGTGVTSSTVSGVAGSTTQAQAGPSVGFSVQTEGGYYQIEKLLDAMDHLPRLVVITSVSLSAVGPSVAGYPQSDGEILTATIKGSAFESKKGA